MIIVGHMRITLMTIIIMYMHNLNNKFNHTYKTSGDIKMKFRVKIFFNHFDFANSSFRNGFNFFPRVGLKRFPDLNKNYLLYFLRRCIIRICYLRLYI